MPDHIDLVPGYREGPQSWLQRRGSCLAIEKGLAEKSLVHGLKRIASRVVTQKGLASGYREGTLSYYTEGLRA